MKQTLHFSGLDAYLSQISESIKSDLALKILWNREKYRLTIVQFEPRRWIVNFAVLGVGRNIEDLYKLKDYLLSIPHTDARFENKAETFACALNAQCSLERITLVVKDLLTLTIEPDANEEVVVVITRPFVTKSFT